MGKKSQYLFNVFSNFLPILWLRAGEFNMTPRKRINVYFWQFKVNANWSYFPNGVWYWFAKSAAIYTAGSQLVCWAVLMKIPPPGQQQWLGHHLGKFMLARCLLSYSTWVCQWPDQRHQYRPNEDHSSCFFRKLDSGPNICHSTWDTVLIQI